MNGDVTQSKRWIQFFLIFSLHHFHNDRHNYEKWQNKTVNKNVIAPLSSH